MRSASLELFSWSMEAVQARDEWRFASTTSGVLSVMTPGTIIAQQLYASNLDLKV